MQLLGLELRAPGSGPIHRGLDVMHELGSGLLVGTGYQFAECAIDAHEQPVSLVITNALDQRAVGSPRQSAANLADQPVEARRQRSPDMIMDRRLELGRIEILIVVERKALRRPQQYVGERRGDLNRGAVRERYRHAGRSPGSRERPLFFCRGSLSVFLGRVNHAACAFLGPAAMPSHPDGLGGSVEDRLGMILQVETKGG